MSMFNCFKSDQKQTDKQAKYVTEKITEKPTSRQTNRQTNKQTNEPVVGRGELAVLRRNHEGLGDEIEVL